MKHQTLKTITIFFVTSAVIFSFFTPLASQERNLNNDIFFSFNKVQTCEQLNISPFARQDDEIAIGVSWEVIEKENSTNNIGEVVDSLFNQYILFSENNRRNALAYVQLTGVKSFSNGRCIQLYGVLNIPKYTDEKIAGCMEPVLQMVALHEYEHVVNYKVALEKALNKDFVEEDIGKAKLKNSINDTLVDKKNGGLSSKELANAIAELSKDSQKVLDTEENQSTLQDKFAQLFLEACEVPFLTLSVYDRGRIKSLVKSLVKQPGYREHYGYKYPKTIEDELLIGDQYKHFKPCKKSNIGKLVFSNPSSFGPVTVESIDIKSQDNIELNAKLPFEVNSGESVEIHLLAQATRWNWVKHNEIAKVTVTTSSEGVPSLASDFNYILESDIPGDFDNDNCSN